MLGINLENKEFEERGIGLLCQLMLKGGVNGSVRGWSGRTRVNWRTGIDRWLKAAGFEIKTRIGTVFHDEKVLATVESKEVKERIGCWKIHLYGHPSCQNVSRHRWKQESNPGAKDHSPLGAVFPVHKAGMTP